MKEASFIRYIVKLICAFPLALHGSAYALDYKGLELLKTYTPHELNNVVTPIACARNDSNQFELGKFTDLEAMTNLKLCGFKDATITGEQTTGDMFFRRDARLSRILLDKSVDYYDRIKNALTKKYDQPTQVEVHMDLYDELYNQNSSGRRSVKWRLMF